MRHDLTVIQPWIEEGARVLDLGCGDGMLLAALRENRKVFGIGLEIDHDNINQAMGRGVNVIEHDLNTGLANFQDNSFDVVVMTMALQTLRYPHRVIDEMLRVGKQCVVTFPNFGYWRSRWYLGAKGRMPVSEFLPYTWYDTPNIHFCTVQDFEQLCRDKGIRVLNSVFVDANNRQGPLCSRLPNLFGVTAIYHISK